MADIRDLARYLNISTGTVSRALNNRPGVNAKTRARVLEAAGEIGYVANQSGRNLRRGATNSIGFLVETGEASKPENGEFFFTVVDQMTLYLSERGYDLVVLPCHSADDPVEYLARTVARGAVDAMVITATRRHDRRIELLAQTQLPFLALGRSESGGEFPWIDLDFAGVARRSVAELLALGHREIAVGLPQTEAMLGYHYLWGFQSAMREAGLDPEKCISFRAPNSEAGWTDVVEMLVTSDRRPTAVMLCTDATTVWLYRALERCGVRPGRDLSVVTFREHPQASFLNPAPACFRVDVAALGRLLAVEVLALLTGANGSAGSEQGILVPMEFVSGASIAPPPVAVEQKA